MKHLDIAKFRHKTQVKVRNYEIDWQGIVHNAVYLYYFEIGRIAYLEQLGLKIDLKTIQHDAKVVVARNEIDYLSSAHFGDMLNVYTRVAYIRNTSFAFEGILEIASPQRRIAENVSVHVWTDERTNKPRTVGEDFRSRVREYEGESVLITNPTISQ